MLKSYTEFKSYVDSIKAKVKELKGSLEENQKSQGAAKQEFADAFGNHENADPAIKKLKSLKDVEGVIKDQLDIIESTNFHKSELAKQVMDEYRESEKQVREKCSSLWTQAEEVRAAAEKQVETIGNEYQDIQVHLYTVLAPQAREVISHLDVSQETKNSMFSQLERNIYLTPIPSPRKYYGNGHI